MVENFWKFLVENMMKMCLCLSVFVSILYFSFYMSLSWSLSSLDDKLSENRWFVWSKRHTVEKVKSHNTDNWEPGLMTIFVTWHLIVTLDSIRNSCNVFNPTSNNFSMLCLPAPVWRLWGNFTKSLCLLTNRQLLHPF